MWWFPNFASSDYRTSTVVLRSFGCCEISRFGEGSEKQFEASDRQSGRKLFDSIGMCSSVKSHIYFNRLLFKVFVFDLWKFLPFLWSHWTWLLASVVAATDLILLLWLYLHHCYNVSGASLFRMLYLKRYTRAWCHTFLVQSFYFTLPLTIA